MYVLEIRKRTRRTVIYVSCKILVRASPPLFTSVLPHYGPAEVRWSSVRAFRDDEHCVPLGAGPFLTIAAKVNCRFPFISNCATLDREFRTAEFPELH